MNQLVELREWLGWLVASILAAWQFIQYRAEHKESIEAKLSIRIGADVYGMTVEQWLALPEGFRRTTPACGLEVNVVNTSRVRIYLKAVVLRLGEESDSVGSMHLELPFKAVPPKDEPLEPKESRRFVLVPIVGFFRGWQWQIREKACARHTVYDKATLLR